MFQKPVERGDVVDALAGIGTFAEQIVIQIRGRACVLIQTGFTAEQTGVARCPALRFQMAHARLDDGVAGDDRRAFAIERRPIQRVIDGFDHAARAVPRQLSIAVERNDVADRANAARIADDQ